MKSEKLHEIAKNLDGLDKVEWNTLKHFIDWSFEDKAIKSGIRLNGLEIYKALKK